MGEPSFKYYVVGASLSEPHTSKLVVKNLMFLHLLHMRIINLCEFY